MLGVLKARSINLIFYYVNHVASKILPLLSPIIKQTPVVLHIRITSKCNLSCPFCYLKDGLNQDEKNHLSIQEWRKILIQLPRTTIIDITGSEPFMAKDFAAFLMLLKELGFKCSITTNGTIFNEKIIDLIMNSSIEYLLVSLDGLEKKHNELRGSDKAFERTKIFIKAILEKRSEQNSKRPIVNVKSMILDETVDEIEELIHYCDKEIKPDIMTLNLPFENNARGGLFLEEDLSHEKFKSGNTFKFEKPEKIIDLITKINKKKSIYKIPLILKPSFSKENLIKYIKDPETLTANNCTLYQNNLTLYYDGAITPCDIGMNITNIRELNYDLRSVYNHQRFKAFKVKKTKNKRVCEGCVFSAQSPKVNT